MKSIIFFFALIVQLIVAKNIYSSNDKEMKKILDKYESMKCPPGFNTTLNCNELEMYCKVNCTSPEWTFIYEIHPDNTFIGPIKLSETSTIKADLKCVKRFKANKKCYTTDKSFYYTSIILHCKVKCTLGNESYSYQTDMVWSRYAEKIYQNRWKISNSKF